MVRIKFNRNAVNLSLKNNRIIDLNFKLAYISSRFSHHKSNICRNATIRKNTLCIVMVPTIKLDRTGKKHEETLDNEWLKWGSLGDNNIQLNHRHYSLIWSWNSNGRQMTNIVNTRCFSVRFRQRDTIATMYTIV